MLDLWAANLLVALKPVVDKEKASFFSLANPVRLLLPYIDVLRFDVAYGESGATVSRNALFFLLFPYTTKV